MTVTTSTSTKTTVRAGKQFFKLLLCCYLSEKFHMGMPYIVLTPESKSTIKIVKVSQ